MEKTGSRKNGDKLRDEGTKWLARIQKRLKAEQDWRDAAAAAEKAYAVDEMAEHGRLYDFNILHSNVETIVPAIYNSTPVPDIRRRFNDKDPIAREFADILERCISIQTDDNRLDAEIERQAQDAFLSGRGIVRLRFEADTEERETENGEQEIEYGVASGEDAEQQPEEPGTQTIVSNERVSVEAVSWRDFVMGKAQRWSDVPWIAFRHHIDRDEMERLTDGELYQAQIAGTEDNKPLLDQDNDDVFIWEIWCKRSKTVKFIRDEDGFVLSMKDDPLGLTGFFPMPEPVQPITLTGHLTPVCPFKVYEKLANELDLITKRIMKITSGLKVRGGFAGNTEDVTRIADADDNELIPLANLEQLAATKGLDGAITWWPIDKAIQVLRELYQHREIIKQSIYEITGISDIVRGASNSGETATAQQIKTQWGSLRIQKMQRLVQRQVRDVYVIMAEIITSKFSPERIEQMTGTSLIPQPTDAPEQVQQKLALADLFNNPQLAAYRIDIESDSTIRADMTRMRGEMNEFLNGTASFFAAMQPIVAAEPQLGAPAAEIYGSFARNFQLGRQAESAIDGMIELAQQVASQPKPPSPDQIKSEMEAKKADAEAQVKASDQQLQAQKIQIDANLEREKIGLEREKLAIERDKMAMDMGRMEAENRRYNSEQELRMAEKAITNDEQGKPMNTASLLAKALANMQAQQAKPKQIIYDDAGRVVGIAPVEATETMQ